MSSDIKSYTTINKGKVVLVGTKKGETFYKNVKRSKHLFKKANAYGIDYGVFQQAELDGCAYISITEKELGIIFYTNFAMFRKHGFRHTFKGYGEQIFLAQGYFNIDDKEQVKLGLEGWG